MLVDTFKDQLVSIKEAYMMGVPAMLLAALTSYTGASGESFLIWIIVSSLDLVFGVICAIMYGKFDASKLYKWVFKIFVQLVTVIIFAGVLRAFKLAADVELFFGSWILFFYIMMDATSIFDKMLLLGVLPKPAYVFFSFFRKRSIKVLTAAFNDPDLVKELEKVIDTKQHNSTVS